MIKKVIGVVLVCLGLALGKTGAAAEATEKNSYSLESGGLTLTVKENNSFILKAGKEIILQDDFAGLSYDWKETLMNCMDGKISLDENLKKVTLTYDKEGVGRFQRQIILLPQECVIAYDWEIQAAEKEGKTLIGQIGLSIPKEFQAGKKFSLMLQGDNELSGILGSGRIGGKGFHYVNPSFLKISPGPEIEIIQSGSPGENSTLDFQDHNNDYRLVSTISPPKRPVRTTLILRVKLYEEKFEKWLIPHNYKYGYGQGRQDLLDLITDKFDVILRRNNKYVIPGEEEKICLEYFDTEGKDRNLEIQYKLLDYYENAVKEGSFTLASQGKTYLRKEVFRFASGKTGMYKLVLSYREPKTGIARERQAIFALFPEPKPSSKDTVFGGTMHWNEYSAKLASTCGMNWISTRFYWGGLEPEERGRFTFGEPKLPNEYPWPHINGSYDEAVALAEKYHLHILAVLDDRNVPPKYMKEVISRFWTKGVGTKNWASDEFLVPWLEQVKAIVTRYKGKVAAYELFNEVGGFISISPEGYLKVLKETYKTIQAIDPDALVLAVCGDANLDPYDKLFAIGGLDYLDGVTGHYIIPGRNPLDYGGRGFGMMDWADRMRNLMRKYGGKEKLIWDTEDSIWIDGRYYERTYPYQKRDVDDEQEQVPKGKPYYAEASERIAKALLASAAAGVKYFAFTGLAPGAYWSFCELDGSPTPPAVAYAVLSNLIGEASFKELKKSLHAQVYLFEGTGGQTACIFGYNLDEKKDRRIILPISVSRLKAVNIMGDEVILKGDGNRTIIPVSREPIYIVGTALKFDEFSSGFKNAKFEGFEEAETKEEPPVETGKGGGIWAMEEGRGDTIKDSSPNKNDGKIYGATWVKGDFGYALSFDGVDDYVEIPPSPSLNIDKEITVSVWTKPLAYTSHGPIVVKGPSIMGGPSYMFRIATVDCAPNEERITFGICTPYAENYICIFNKPPLNQWRHYVLVSKAGGPTKFYIDGNLETTLGVTPAGKFNFYPAYPVRMGISYDGKFKFKGLIGEVKILSRVLSDEEVIAEYQSSAPGYKVEH